MSSVPTKQDLEIAAAICVAAEHAFRQKAAQFGLLAEQCQVEGESHLEKIFGTGFTIHGLQILIKVVNQPELLEFLDQMHAQKAPHEEPEPEETASSPHDPLNLWGDEQSASVKPKQKNGLPFPSGPQYMWRGPTGLIEGI